MKSFKIKVNHKLSKLKNKKMNKKNLIYQHKLPQTK